MPDVRCAALILAAGSSSRLGHPKQLVEIDGEPLLRRTARLALEAGCEPVCVVLGYEAEKIEDSLRDMPLTAVRHQDWSEGMGSSLAAGMRFLTSLDAVPASVLLLVCDQLELSAATLRELLRAHEAGRSPLTASRYGGTLGVPAVFASVLFSELLAITGDRGAKQVIDAHRSKAMFHDFPGGARDLDTQGQLDADDRVRPGA